MSQIRKKGVTVSKQIVIGTYSFEIGDDQRKKGNDAGEMYLWYCMVRSPTGEDLSYWIKAVEFTLHESFVQRERIVTEPPFVLEERGWGEFDLIIKLIFQDPAEKDVIISHKLALRPTGFGVVSPVPDVRGRCVRNEALDTIVFYEPHEWFYDVLMAGPTCTSWERREETAGAPQNTYLFLRNHFSVFNEEREASALAEIMSAVAFVQSEITTLKRELMALELQSVFMNHQQQALADRAIAMENSQRQLPAPSNQQSAPSHPSGMRR